MPSFIDHGRRTANQADRRIGRERLDVPGQMPGAEHVVLVDDGDERSPAELDAPIPVAGQTEPLFVD